MSIVIGLAIVAALFVLVDRLNTAQRGLAPTRGRDESRPAARTRSDQ